MNLQDLNNLAKDFNLDPTKLGFHGEHDVVYLDMPDEEYRKLPNIEELLENTEELYTFCSQYNMCVIEGYWGFYS